MVRFRYMRWLVPLGLVVLLAPACSNGTDEGFDTTLAPSTTVVEVPTTAESTSTTSPPTTTGETSADGLVGLSVDQLPPSVAAFKTAYESGDLETIQALFTDDGIMTTTANVLELYDGDDSHLGTWDKNGAEFRRLATLHHGEMLITDAIQVGDRAVAFDWEWEDFASGTAILHLRGDQIVVAVLAVTEYEIPEHPN